MAKKKTNARSAGAGVKLIGSSSELINLMISDGDQKKRATKSLDSGGPKHKQVLSALLCKRLHRLVKTIEKTSGTSFALQQGYVLPLKNEDDELDLSIPIPINLGRGIDKQKIIKVISDAPEHEALIFVMALQVIEWAIGATGSITMDRELDIKE